MEGQEYRQALTDKNIKEKATKERYFAAWILRLVLYGVLLYVTGYALESHFPPFPPRNTPLPPIDIFPSAPLTETKLNAIVPATAAARGQNMRRRAALSSTDKSLRSPIQGVFLHKHVSLIIWAHHAIPKLLVIEYGVMTDLDSI